MAGFNMDNFANNRNGFPSPNFAMSPVDGSQPYVSTYDITPIGEATSNLFGNYGTDYSAFGSNADVSGRTFASGLLGGRMDAAQNISQNGYQGADLMRQGAGALKGAWGDMSNIEKFNTGLGGVKSIMDMYSSFKQISAAKKQMALQRDMWNKQWGAARNTLNESSAYRARLRNNNDPVASKREADKYKV